MADNQHTWLTHLLRWLNGEATRKDEQRLDALAQDDPFLTEALQGYRSLPEANHAAAVTRLKAKLRRKNERQRTVGFYLLRAAAVGLVLAAAWVVFQQFQGKDMAMADSEILPEMQSEPAPPVATVPTELQAKSLDSTSLAARETAKNQDVILERKAPRTVPAPPIAAQEKPADEPSPVASYRVQTAPEAERKAAFSTDSIEEEIAQAADAAASGAAEETAPRLQKSAPAEKNPLEKDQAKSAKKQWVAEPEGGFGNLEKHIQKNLRYPSAAAQNNIEGEVTLSFRFKNDGIPTDFRVEKSLGYGCDEEAERLLREGPRWKFTSGARVSYTVAFKK